jgi:hypothetical protein
MTSPSQTVTFTLDANTAMREVYDSGVDALDSALTALSNQPLMHLYDPTRIKAFASGGPPTWSVAFVPIENDHLFVTYGLSDRIDPARKGCGFELSIRVPAKQAGVWPGLFLRGLSRYIITSGRELRVGDFMPFPGPLTRFALSPAAANEAPDTRLDAAFFVRDPLLPSVKTPRGDIEVRRAVGLDAAERELMEPWSTAGFAQLFTDVSPTLVTDIVRATRSADASFVAKLAEGSRREGSQFGFVAVPDVGWETVDGGFTVRFPGGHHARRIHSMLQARLPFGRKLLVHDVDPEQPLAIGFEPGEHLTFQQQEEVLVVTVPRDHPLLSVFGEAPDAPEIVLNLGA